MPTETTSPSLARPVDAFHVIDAKTASWVARKINEARAHQRRVKAWAERELRRAQRREAFLLARFGGELEAWARAELAQRRTKLKTIDLPGGKLSFRTERSRLVITDESRLIAWAKVNLPSSVRIVESILKSDVSRHVSETGEHAEGTDITAGGERFIIR